jgi:hypothetical protein
MKELSPNQKIKIRQAAEGQPPSIRRTKMGVMLSGSENI